MSTNMESVFRIGKQASVLPAGYTQLEYIETTAGTEYIDPQVTGNARWVITAQTNTIKGSSQSLISSTTQAAGGTWYGEFTTTKHWDIVSGGTTIAPTTKTTADLTFDSNGATGTIGGVSVTRLIAVTQGDWRIFGTASGVGPYVGKLFDAKVYQNNTLVRNFIPAKRNSDNVLGMYDLVSQTFFTNQGTGTFTAGPVVEVCKISQNNQTIWERAISLESDKDSEVTFRSTRNESKNLFDGKLYLAVQGLSTASIVSPKTEITLPYTTTTSWRGAGFVIKCKKNTTYKLSCSSSSGIYSVNFFAVYEKEEDIYTRSLALQHETISFNSAFTSNYDGYLVIGLVRETAGEVDVTDIQLEEGSTATSYQPYWNTLPELDAYGNTAQPSAIKPYVKTAISTTPTTFNSELAGPLNVLADGKTEQHNIPAEYQELEYIESTGTQYIDTGYAKPSVNVDLKVRVSFADNTNRYLIGVSNTSPNYIGRYNNASFEINNTYTNMKTVINEPYDMHYYESNNSLYLVVTDKNGNSETLMSAGGTTSTNNWKVFGNNGGSIVTFILRGRIYSFALSSDGVNVRNLIPARRNSDFVIGMYDTVTNTFFTNAGTGSFTAGPVKTPTPDAPMDLVCNNGVIKYGYKDLPAGYDKLEYLQSDGESYLIVPYRANNKTVFYCRYNEIRNGSQTANAVFGVTDLPEPSKANYGILRLTGATFNRMGWGDNITGSVINVTAPKSFNTWYEVLYDRNELYQDGTLYATSATPNDTEWAANYDLGIFARNSSSVTMPAIAKISSVWVKEDGEYKVNLIPAKRLSDSVLGMYDLVSQTFFTNQGTGTFTAGNIITREIYIDGTQEKITVSGKNLFNEVYPSVTSNFQYMSFFVGKNKTVTCSYGLPHMENGASMIYFLNGQVTAGALNNINQVDADVSRTITTSTGYVTIAYRNGDNIYLTGKVPGDYHCQIEEGSTATSYEPYHTPQIVNVEMLNKIGTYEDVQELSSGKVTKNIGIKVFDGTENIILTPKTGYNVFDYVVTGKPNEKVECICSSFYYNINASSNTVLDLQCGGYTSERIFFRYDAMTTVEDFKAYLASEYAKGTPVIIVYPLATPTTSTVTAQPITQAVGTNIATISEGSITSLVGEVSGINQTQTTPTPESPLDIVSNNGVIKYGQYGKNLFDENSNYLVHKPCLSGGTFPNASGTWADSITYFFDVKPNTTYTYSCTTAGDRFGVFAMNTPVNPNDYTTTSSLQFDRIVRDIVTSSVPTTYTFTTNANEHQVAIYCALNTAPTNIQIEEGSTATSYEPYHFGLHVDGTQEKITVSGKNLFDKDNTTSAYLDANGVATTYNNFTCSDFIEIKPNTAYTFSGQDTSIRTDNGQRICFYDSSKTFISPRQGGEHKTVGNWSFTTTSQINAKYIRVSCGNCINIQLEEGSVATSYEPYRTPQSVLATMLNKVGDYTDIQNIVNGSVSKNVGIKVFDGTESWSLSISTHTRSGVNRNNFYTLFNDAPRADSNNVVCSISQSITTTTSLYLAPVCRITSSNNFNIVPYEDTTTIPDVTAWTNWLKAQYAKGTPVIVLYPLATPTTESVVAQDIDINKGTYTAEVTEASLVDLDISVKYLGND